MEVLSHALDDGRLSTKLEKYGKIGKKKAIDIGNAMLKDGYQEDNAIPIATKQAEDWYKNATEDDLKALKNKNHCA